MPQNLRLLRTVVMAATQILDDKLPEPSLVLRLQPLLETLLFEKDWLPEQFSRPDPRDPQHYLLHCDPLERFSLVCVVLAPGQATPLHEYPVWGLIGALRGAALCGVCSYADNHLRRISTERISDNGIICVGARIADFYEIKNALPNSPFVMVGFFGGNIGTMSRRRIISALGKPDVFSSGYANTTIPNIWTDGTNAPSQSQSNQSLH